MVNKSIFEYHIEQFNNYVQNIPVDDKFKNIYFIDNFDTPAFYYYYPKLFSKQFSIKEKDVITLSIAGFFIYKAIIYNDVIIDNHHSDENKKKILLIKSNIYYEEGIKLLSSILPLNNKFWEKWYIRKIEFFKGIEYEKFKNNQDISFNDFENLATWKCAIGKLAIDALYSIDSLDLNNYNAICISHDYFSKALQILDDISDIKKDFESGQPNIALSYLRQELKVQKINIDNQTGDTLEKYLYVTSIAVKLFNIGIAYLNKASDNVAQLNLEYWDTLLNSYKTHFITSSGIIATYIKQVQSTATQSNQLIVKGNNITKQNIYKRLTLGNSYILNCQNENGSWEDFVTSASVSDIWTTAFILNNLTAEYSQTSKDKAFNFITENNATAWGYKVGYPYDADSSNFSILAHGKNKLQKKEMFTNLFEFQNEDGGFGTYNEKNIQLLKMRMGANEGMDFSGWTNSHMCVSSVTLNLLLKYGYHESEECIKLKAYLLNRINKYGIESYWWTSKAYTLSMLMECLPYLVNEPLSKTIYDSANMFMQKEFNTPIISDTYVQSPYYTGLILKSILLSENLFSDYEEKIMQSFKCLLKSQFKDGSWINTPSLRVPAPSEHFPENSTNYRIFEMGVGVRAPEYNRLFTTSTIIKALENLTNVI